MINILGWTLQLPAGLEFLAQPVIEFIINVTAWLLVAVVVNFVFLRLLKFVTRRLPGEVEDIILSILSRPIIILILLYGANLSLRQLQLVPQAYDWIDIISITILVMVVTHVLGRLIKDILIHYGSKWAARTETRVDDVLIPVLNLFGPLVLALTAALIILPMWGININSVLLGAGVLGLVLGLALQETLGNIFSGLSLLIEAPFKKGDLVLLNDGRTCEVLHLGMRSTVVFSLDEQATIFIPNKMLASTILVNLTKPTSEQRFSIEIPVSTTTNLAAVQHMLIEVANGHPAVLSSNMDAKLVRVKAQVESIRLMAQKLEGDAAVSQSLLLEAEKNEKNLIKLEAEGNLNNAILEFKEALRELIRGITAREVKGLSEGERQEIYCNFISPAENGMSVVIHLTRTWVEIQDAWLNSNDFWSQRKMWDNRMEQLQLKWERLKKIIYSKDDRNEMRLDDFTINLLEWIEKEYKLPPGYWKNPMATIKRMEKEIVVLQLSYYVDNIRLEHDTRARRVQTEISRMILEKMKAIEST